MATGGATSAETVEAALRTSGAQAGIGFSEDPE